VIKLPGIAAVSGRGMAPRSLSRGPSSTSRCSYRRTRTGAFTGLLAAGLTDEAASIAVQFGGRALLRDHGGGFSLATVDLHWVSAQNYAGDPGAAVAAALRIVPASLPTTERRARYWTDTARAYANWGGARTA
jgi:hypothetical protein